MTPAWLLDVVAALMLAVAAVSAARLAAARPWRPGTVITDTDVAHLLMAIAMAGVLAASLTTLPDTAWEVVFGLLTAWFAVRLVLDTRANGLRALAGGHCAPHLAHSAAMLYMFLALAAPAAQAGAMSGMAGMAGMSGGNSTSMMALRYPTLAFAFALILVGYSVWDLDQVSARRYRLAAAPLAGVPQQVTVTAEVPAGPASGPGFGETLLAPAVTVGCRVIMGVAMVFMLLIAI
jgi:Domain of unknown function (DUF5134)